MISASNALRTSARKSAIEQRASLAHYGGLSEGRSTAGFLEGREGRMAATATAPMVSATMMPMPAAVMAMAIPVRMMPPVIAAVVTIIVAVMTVAAAT
jgi:hypothetical protein